ncbi:MAG: hypothetical protein SGPRY_008505 [Prymnesium sp.]
MPMGRNLEDGLARIRALLAAGAERGLGSAGHGLRDREVEVESSAAAPPLQIARAAAAKRTEYNF